MFFSVHVMLACSEDEDEIILNVECHFSRAKIGNCIFSLGDCAYIKVIALSFPSMYWLWAFLLIANVDILVPPHAIPA